MTKSRTLGAHYTGDGRCEFVVWAPKPQSIELLLPDRGGLALAMERYEDGYYGISVPDGKHGERYSFRLNGEKLRPDPASRYQPEGVHGPSAVVRSDFSWSDDAWTGIPLERYAIYELHVGTFSASGSFEGVEERLSELVDLGITAIELMPVAEFPGRRNWGYDGVYPFAVHSAYGGPAGLKKLVDAAHRAGLAVVLDVVYNHLGPEGNYTSDFGPYFTTKYQTPWGASLNFDDAYSDGVRRFFIENALQWIDEFHIDALRLDAIHAIVDTSAYPFLRELSDAVKDRAASLGRSVHLMAESDSNDIRVCLPSESGGLGCDAQWSDDFHHSIHGILTGEKQGYYSDFGGISHLETAIRDGFVYQGQYSEFRKRRHGSRPRALALNQFIVCSQNHDQVGNRMLGERLSNLVSFESLQLAAGAVILGSSIPLLFMGEEYGETAPFLYFVEHSDPGLVEAVRQGRREEFSSFSWKGEPPDPQSEETFLRSKLNHALASSGRNKVLRTYYQELFRLRWNDLTLFSAQPATVAVSSIPEHSIISVCRQSANSASLFLLNLSDQPQSATQEFVNDALPLMLTSADRRWRDTSDTDRFSPRTEGTYSFGEEVVLAPRSFNYLYLEKK